MKYKYVTIGGLSSTQHAHVRPLLRIYLSGGGTLDKCMQLQCVPGRTDRWACAEANGFKIARGRGEDWSVHG